ncbi:LuxR C-terminal-related transcriptional regulator [Kitasatospora sp. NBC_01539]|uniref:LuxR C-terminal-related transcriptional regulator n=1 Tax=Kitasatospora sp. NBC_01539 TaxID=2903577 RepID=UPI0038602693
MSGPPLDESLAPMPDEAEQALYLRLLSDGGRLPADAVPADDRAVLDRLVRVGLVTRTDDSYAAVSPRALSGRLSAELRSQATRLLVRAESLPDLLGGLTQAYDTALPAPASAGPVEVLHDRTEIQHRIARLLSESRHEMLTAQPDPRPEAGLRLALQQDLPFLRRGGDIRTLYRGTALDEPGTVAYAAEVTRHGGQVRILDEPFRRMLVFDRHTAVIQAGPDRFSAAFVSEPAMVDHLVSSFERDWRHAEAVGWAEPGPADRVPERIGRLLAQGLTQRSVATRLGLSERTVAAHISRLRDRYGARTLFQLGWLMRGGPRG